MPELSRFFGIIITMYYKEHGVPHFHAKYNNFRATLSISDLTLLEGELPKRVLSFVLEWAFEHRKELEENWDLVISGKPTKKIEPLS